VCKKRSCGCFLWNKLVFFCTQLRFLHRFSYKMEKLIGIIINNGTISRFLHSSRELTPLPLPLPLLPLLPLPLLPLLPLPLPLLLLLPLPLPLLPLPPLPLPHTPAPAHSPTHPHTHTRAAHPLAPAIAGPGVRRLPRRLPARQSKC
jgi:hypothetical protein